MLRREGKLPSPAVSFVGRHDSGKTTLIVKVIAELTARGVDVACIKHHGHAGFDIDIPGKDSFRHREAGAREVVIAAPGRVARICDEKGEAECVDLVATMPGHDIVVVEGYRKSGLPSIEIMREGAPEDAKAAALFLQRAKNNVPLTCDFAQDSRSVQKGGSLPVADAAKMPAAATVAVVSDILAARKGAELYGIPWFDINDSTGICDFLQARIMRQPLTVAIQAGGESRRMGYSKALVPFQGRPLIHRIVERVAPVADELIITTNEPDALAFLHEAYPDRVIRLVPDLLPTRGALPGLVTALSAASHDFVAIVACDMIYASSRLIAAENAELTLSQADAVVPVDAHGFEPMHGVYRRDACLAAARTLAQEGIFRVRSLYDHVVVQPFFRSRVLRAEPQGGCFMNVNTPEDLHAAERGMRADQSELM